MASADAQRVIALSIGKLQASRSQRGGIDLHKNLLVSHVLYTARTVLLTGMVPEYYRAETTSVQSDSEDETVDCPETVEEVAVPVAESTESDSALPSGEGEEETKNLCTLTPVVDLAQPPLTSASGNVDSRLQEADLTLTDSVDKENLSSEQQQNVSTTSLQPAVLGERCTNVPTASCDGKRSAAPCSCCRKRKQSETEAACDSISPKKRRIEQQEADSETDSWETTEDMCTESPVSSLVSIFNSGFKGLVHSSIELESEPSQQAVPRSGPNSSKQGLQQCMQEVVTSIGTLARPIVAF
ncbi:immediate early response gene 5-like protein isoform X1 [Branchiostoma lanceolatum]|uniref:immediate early response gene 5-like protein isoform X1 n=1 Tax=Branchiostoma lanceolatum TaxID=7740 RepID=UPI0034534A4F